MHILGNLAIGCLQVRFTAATKIRIELRELTEKVASSKVAPSRGLKAEGFLL